MPTTPSAQPDHSATASPVTPESPVRIKPTTRLMEPIALVCAAIAVTAWWQHLKLFPYVAGAYALGLAATSVLAHRGRLTVGPDGLSVRSPCRSLTVGWDDMWSLSVKNGLFSRYITLRTNAGQEFNLPSLRAARGTRGRRFQAGLDTLDAWLARSQSTAAAMTRSRPARRWVYPSVVVALALGSLTVDRPWYWVAFHEVAQAPDTCQVLASGPAATLGHVPSLPFQVDSPGITGTGCRWSGMTELVELTYYRYHRQGLLSGTGAAMTDLAGVQEYLDMLAWIDDRREGSSVTTRNAPQPVAIRSIPDLGDEAFISMGGAQAIVVVRHANVIVMVSCQTTAYRTNAIQLALDVARHAVSALGS